MEQEQSQPTIVEKRTCFKLCCVRVIIVGSTLRFPSLLVDTEHQAHALPHTGVDGRRCFRCVLLPQRSRSWWGGQTLTSLCVGAATYRRRGKRLNGRTGVINW